MSVSQLDNTALMDATAESPVMKTGSLFASGALASWFSAALLLAMAATLTALLWFPITKALSYQEVNYNEGWNAYKQQAAANGIPLYGAPRARFTGVTGYPPLSFHLVGWLGRQSGSFTQAGRRLGLVSLLAAGILIGLTVHRMTGNYKAAVFCFLLYEMGIVLLLPNHVGMNDPQFPAEALCAAGLYFYLRDPRSPRLLCLSALAFCLAGFYKQSIIAFPLAIGLDLLLRSWKSCLLWTGALLASAGVLTALTVAVDGRYFFADLGGKRAYLFLEGIKTTHTYLSTVQIPLLAAIIWCICTRRRRRAVVALLLLTHLIAVFFAGGDGVDLNIFYGAWLATILVCGLALAELDVAPSVLGSALQKPGVSVMVMFALFLSLLANVPRGTFYQYKEARALHSDGDNFRAAVDFLKARPGPALCESLILCFEAGKEYEFDPYYVKDRITTGFLHESDVVERIRSGHFQTIQILLNREDQAQIVSASLAFRNDGYFTSPEIKELLDDYQLAMRTPKMLIFVPRDNSLSRK